MKIEPKLLKSNLLKNKIMVDISMNTMIQLTTIEGKSKYDLYISSKHRDNLRVDLGPNDKDISCFEILYENDKEKYESLINTFKKIEKTHQMIFMGTSNSAAVFIPNGKKLLDFVNKELKNHTNNAYINRIILTSSLKENDPPVIKPTPTSNNFAFPPNYNSPWGNDLQKHIAVYYTKEPSKFYYPTEN